MSGAVLQVLREDWADATVALPAYETIGAAGADIRANLPLAERETGRILAPDARDLIPTGLRMAVPPGFEVQVRPRSGLALKHGISLVNTPGTIDCDYRGPIGILLINHGQEPFLVTHGMRLAQIVVAPVVQAQVAEVSSLTSTDRGAGGFGSTGTG